MKLRDGSETKDPRLNRLVEFDGKNRDYPIRTLLPEAPKLLSRSWAMGPVLNQQKEGSCVGHAFAHDAAANPVPIPDVTEEMADDFYKTARVLDEWPDEPGQEGTSALGGAKAYMEKGYCTSFRWAFSIDEVLQTLSHVGPVIIGISWRESMYETAPGGLVVVEGAAIGGHCLLLTGQDLEKKFDDGQTRHVVEWKNSWGPEYGVDGLGYIEPRELEILLSESGESCVPVGRSLPMPDAITA